MSRCDNNRYKAKPKPRRAAMPAGPIRSIDAAADSLARAGDEATKLLAEAREVVADLKAITGALRPKLQTVESGQ